MVNLHRQLAQHAAVVVVAARHRHAALGVAHVGQNIEPRVKGGRGRHRAAQADRHRSGDVGRKVVHHVLRIRFQDVKQKEAMTMAWTLGMQRISGGPGCAQCGVV